MLKLNTQKVERNGMGVAWMLARNGQAIPVKIHIYGAIDDLEENAAAAIWMLKYAPYDKLNVFLKQFTCWVAANEVHYTTDEEEFKKSLKTRLMSGANLGATVGWTKEEAADYLMGLVEGMSIDDIYDLGETVDYDAGNFVARDLNETFIRVRMGGEYNTDVLTGDTFFRIGSTYKDWTDAIYMFVADHKNVSHIFVERDAESDGKESLTERDVMINNMPREEFLRAEKLPFLGSRHTEGVLGTISNIIKDGNYSDLGKIKINAERLDNLYNKLKMEDISSNYKTIQAPWASKPKNRNSAVFK